MSIRRPSSLPVTFVRISLLLFGGIAIARSADSEPLRVVDPEDPSSTIRVLPGGGFKCMERKETLDGGTVLELTKAAPAAKAAAVENEKEKEEEEEEEAEPQQKVALLVRGKDRLEAALNPSEKVTDLRLTPDKKMAVMGVLFTAGIGGWHSGFLVARKNGADWSLERVLQVETFEKARRNDEWYEAGEPLDNRPVIHCVKAFVPPNSNTVERVEGEWDLATSKFVPFGEPSKHSLLRPKGLSTAKTFYVHLDAAKNTMTLSQQEPEKPAQGILLEAKEQKGRVIYWVLKKGPYWDQGELITAHLRAAFPGLTLEEGAVPSDDK